MCVRVHPSLLCATSPALWLPSGFTPSECHPPKPSLLQTWQERREGGDGVGEGGDGGVGTGWRGSIYVEEGRGQSLKLTSQFH